MLNMSYKIAMKNKSAYYLIFFGLLSTLWLMSSYAQTEFSLMKIYDSILMKLLVELPFVLLYPLAFFMSAIITNWVTDKLHKNKTPRLS